MLAVEQRSIVPPPILLLLTIVKKNVCRVLYCSLRVHSIVLSTYIVKKKNMMMSSSLLFASHWFAQERTSLL